MGLIQVILNEAGQQIVKELEENYRALGFKGDPQFSYEATDLHLIVRGHKKLYWLENGREPNKDQSKEAIIHFTNWAGHFIFKDWVEQNSIDISPYVIAHKIATKGIEVPNQHNPGGVISNVINTKRIEAVGNRLTGAMIQQIKSDVIKILKPN